MSRTKIRRKAASTKGFLRRLEDARFEHLEDPREQNRITHPLEPILNLAALSLVTAARSTRAVEERSEGLKGEVKRRIELVDSISDNAFGLLMPRLEPNDVRKVVRSQIKAEWKRKNLRPTVLPWSTVAIDGKHMATITEQRLRALISQTTPFVGNRYFVGSMSADEMSAEQAYMLARAHWRCENEGHWTADAIWSEDATRTPWTTHPQGVLVVGLLRAVAINILAVLRAMSRINRGSKLEKPAWFMRVDRADGHRARAVGALRSNAGYQRV